MSGLTCPRPPVTDRPDLRHAWWQDIGRYVARWVWERGATVWRCDGIWLRERMDERAAAIIDHETLARWRREGLPADVVERGQQLAREHGWL
jgi:hypothetical protein